MRRIILGRHDPLADAAAGWSPTTFTGPLASDASGRTYFLGTPPSSGPYPDAYSVVALDSCGRQLWQTAQMPAPGVAPPAANPTLLVSGDQVIVQWGSVDAFDTATGASRWSVDLNVVAGENLQLDGAAEVGPSAASNGTLFVPLRTSTETVIVSIGPTGSPSILATIPPSASGDLVSTIVDGAGHIELELNAMSGDLVESFSTTGAPVFSSAFQCSSGIEGPLASGRTFIVTQGGPCLLTLQGDAAFSPMAAGGGSQEMAIDRDDSLYINDSTNVYSFTASGGARWTLETESPFTASRVAGPLLARRAENVLFIAQADKGPADPIHVRSLVAVDTQTGAAIASYPVDATRRLSPCSSSSSRPPTSWSSPRRRRRRPRWLRAGDPRPHAEWPTSQGSGTDGRRAALGW